MQVNFRPVHDLNVRFCVEKNVLTVIIRSRVGRTALTDNLQADDMCPEWSAAQLTLVVASIIHGSCCTNESIAKSMNGIV